MGANVVNNLKTSKNIKIFKIEVNLAEKFPVKTYANQDKQQ